jgi:hypothetical protein
MMHNFKINVDLDNINPIFVLGPITDKALDEIENFYQRN